MYAPFFVDPKFPPVIFLNGEIDERSALQFRRALEANPQVEYLALNSPGGLVQMGLFIADEVHSRKLTTLIPERFECSSSCSLIFLAGHRRAVAGKLGVHQISATTPDMEKAQLTISDIVEALNRYDTPPEVLTKMLRTPPDDMYYFSAEEVAALGLNRDGTAPNVEPAAPAPQAIEPTKTSEAVALEFVQDVVSTHASISASQASGIRRFYADQLGYYGKRLAIALACASAYSASSILR